jgi:hypothetical protein
MMLFTDIFNRHSKKKNELSTQSDYQTIKNGQKRYHTKWRMKIIVKWMEESFCAGKENLSRSSPKQ